MVKLVLWAYFKRFVSFFYSSADDLVWRSWTKKERTMVDVAGVFKGNARDSQKIRSLEILLAPTSHILPYRYIDKIKKENYFREDFYRSFDNYNCSFLKPLTTELLLHACRLIEKYQNICKESGMPTPLWYYNDCVLELLALLPPEHKEIAYKLFSLNDITPWDDFAAESESCSGYNPLFKLLAMPCLDESWKWRAIYDMHAIILAEATGKKPRVWHEDALRSYVKKLGNLLEGGNLPYSKDLLAYQILFIIEADYRRIVSWWFAKKALAILEGDDYKHHRLSLARHVFLTNDEHIYIYNEKTAVFLRRVLDEFSNNEELAAVLASLLEEQAAGMARRN